MIKGMEYCLVFALMQTIAGFIGWQAATFRFHKPSAAKKKTLRKVISRHIIGSRWINKIRYERSGHISARVFRRPIGLVSSVFGVLAVSKIRELEFDTTENRWIAIRIGD